MRRRRSGSSGARTKSPSVAVGDEELPEPPPAPPGAAGTATMADDEVLFDDVYELCEIIGR